MLSVSYVNNENIYSKVFTEASFRYDETVRSINNAIDNSINEYELFKESTLIDSEILDDKDVTLAIYEDANKKLVTKIGEGIINLFDTIIKYITNIIDKIKNLSFKGKKDIDKLDLLIKKHPDLKDNIICSFEKGDLDVSQIRTLKELDSAYDELLKMSKNKNVKPGSMRDKWNRAVKKFENIDKSKVAKTAMATTAVITAVVAISTFSQKLMSSRAELNDAKERINDHKVATAKAIKQLQDDGAITDADSKMQIILKARRYMDMKYKDKTTYCETYCTKFSDAVAKFISKHDKKSSEKAKEYLKHQNYIAGTYADRRNADKSSKTYNDTMARHKAEFDFNKSHIKDITDNMVNSQKAKEQGSYDWKKNNIDNLKKLNEALKPDKTKTPNSK